MQLTPVVTWAALLASTYDKTSCFYRSSGISFSSGTSKSPTSKTHYQCLGTYTMLRIQRDYTLSPCTYILHTPYSVLNLMKDTKLNSNTTTPNPRSNLDFAEVEKNHGFEIWTHTSFVR